MEVEIKIDPTCKTPKIIIAAENITDEVKALAEKLSAEGLRSISGFKDNTARLLEPEEIVRIYSCGGKIAENFFFGGVYTNWRSFWRGRNSSAFPTLNLLI